MQDVVSSICGYIPIVGETSWTLGFDLWNVRFLWEIEKHDQIDHRNEVTTDLG